MEMNEEQIVYLKTSELRNNPNNPRKNDEAVDTVVKSIKKYGFRNPLIVDENGTVWCGNTRLKASKKMGLKVVPCIVVKDLTEKEMTELALLDNKTNEIAEWDDDALAEILATTDFSDFDELDWEIAEEKIEWDNIKELDENTYSEPEHKMLQCPVCGAIDFDMHFKEIKNKKLDKEGKNENIS